MNPNQRKVYQAAIDHFGSENQIMKCLEEMAELSQLLAKNLQGINVFTCSGHFKELADVQIMLNQMTILFGEENFKEAVDFKTNKLALRIAAEKEEKERTDNT